VKELLYAGDPAVLMILTKILTKKVSYLNRFIIVDNQQTYLIASIDIF
jgi:hypothetical protein